jgi:alpha-tubulin suppressor-like RCC1 family protein
MNRSLLLPFASLPVALSMALASNAEANHCNPRAGVSGETVVWDWGQDWGDPGSVGPRLFPVQIPNLKGVTAIAAGGAHTLVLKNDGTVWGWGFNVYGELGDGTNSSRDWDHAGQVSNLTGVTTVAAGQDHSLALKSDGTIWAWGWNPRGVLGDGTEIDRNTPVQVVNLNGAKAIAGGVYHTVALKNDGTVWGWGRNFEGQLGDGTRIDHNTAVQVPDLSGVTCVAAGDLYSLALKSDGTVWAWGANDHGQLGDGTTIQRNAPVPLRNLSEIASVAAGAEHSLALKTDGTVWAWGKNAEGELGDGTTTDALTPVKVKDLSGVAAIAAHNLHNLALRTIQSPLDGIVQAWGYNGQGQLGDGSMINRSSPVSVPPAYLSGVAAIAVGDSHSLALGAPRTYLNVRNILVHPDTHHKRLFNLLIDGIVVRANDNGGSTGPQLATPGHHTVSETGGTGTPIGAFGVVIGGDCATDGTINLALGDQKTCTITNYDNMGTCPSQAICCEPGDGTQGCLKCSKPGHGCP